MDVVSVRVTKTTNVLKIVWQVAEASFPPYSVDSDLLERKGEEVRAELYKLVEQIRRRGIEQAGVGLERLAEAGTLLYEALFHSHDESTVEQVKSWLTRKKKPYRIHFIVEGRIHIPWGLVYDGDTKNLDASEEYHSIEKYQDFWCIKHFLSTVYFRIPPVASENIPADEFCILPLFHKGVFDRVVPSLEETERAAMEHLFAAFCKSSSFNSPLFTSLNFFELWRELMLSSSLVYICCHADQTRLALDTNDTINIDDMQLKLKLKSGTDQESTRFLFLNGCSTAVGNSKGGFIEATGNTGFYGFIGTECKVPDVFAVRFGIDFIISLLYTGKPIFQIMDELRRKHWPLSLIYGIYCYPSLKVCPSPGQPYPFSNSQVNYSLGVLGSDERNELR